LNRIRNACSTPNTVCQAKSAAPASANIGRPSTPRPYPIGTDAAVTPLPRELLQTIQHIQAAVTVNPL
jgi:hypothetical protein